MLRTAAIAAAFLLDALIGDPPSLPHPVRNIGRLITALEKLTREIFPDSPGGRTAAGGLTWAVTAFLSFALPWTAIRLAGKVSVYPAFALDTYWCLRILAARSLCDESLRVCRDIEAGDIPGARNSLSRIVGRDTAELDTPQMIRAVVETIAENASDGVTAPLIYMAAGGAPLAMLYKAVNTMDSMLGYKNEKYIDFGHIPARMDDIFNFVPARITALAMVAAAPLAGLSAGGAFRIWKRDRHNHASPNSGQPESACAGALGVELGGDASYFGRICKKKTLGDPLREIEAEDIKRALRLMYVSSALCLLLLLAVRMLILMMVAK